MTNQTRQKFLAHKGTYIAANGSVQKWADVPALCDSMHRIASLFCWTAGLGATVALFAIFSA